MWSSIRKSNRQSRSRFFRRWALIGLVVLICLLSASLIVYFRSPPTAPKRIEPSQAALSDLSGKVELLADSRIDSDPAARGQRLRPGDRIRTGHNGRATIGFEDGSQATLSPSTTLSLTKSELEDEFHLLLEQGTAELDAAGASKRFQLKSKTLKNSVTLRKGKAKFRSTANGMGVQAGSKNGVNVALASGGELKLQAGSAVDLTEPKGEISVRLKIGEIELSAQKAGVRGVRVIFGEGEDFLFVRQGQAKLAMTTEGVRVQAVVGEIVLHRAGQVTNLEPGAELVVSLGEVKILRREAQPTAPEQNEKAVRPAAPKVQAAFGQSAHQVPAREGSRTRVYVDRRRAWIGFRWNEDPDGQTGILEVSRSPAFGQLALRLPVSGGHFASDDLDPGKYYWRVIQSGEGDAGGAAGPVGQLEVVLDPHAVQEGSKEVHDTVQDTGAETKILFQGEPPRLKFVWDAVKGAASYLIRIFAEKDMQNPIVVEKVTTPRFHPPVGTLGIGTYYWYQSALANDGNPLQTSRLNKLTIAFHNVVRLLRIDSPRPGQPPQRGSVWLRGKAARGSKLTVNNRPIRLTGDGHFKHRLSGVKPGQVLLFQLKKGTGGAVYFVRHLGG